MVISNNLFQCQLLADLVVQRRPRWRGGRVSAGLLLLPSLNYYYYYYHLVYYYYYDYNHYYISLSRGRQLGGSDAEALPRVPAGRSLLIHIYIYIYMYLSLSIYREIYNYIYIYIYIYIGPKVLFAFALVWFPNGCW